MRSRQSLAAIKALRTVAFVSSDRQYHDLRRKTRSSDLLAVDLWFKECKVRFSISARELLLLKCSDWRRALLNVEPSLEYFSYHALGQVTRAIARGISLLTLDL